MTTNVVHVGSVTITSTMTDRVTITIDVPNVVPWILTTGFWVDAAYWHDTDATWNDAP